MDHSLTAGEALFWIAVALVSIGGSARITRLVTFDVFPPIAAVRNWYVEKVGHDNDWSFLLRCGYCFGLWAALFTLGTGYLSDWHWAWWLFNGWLTVGYAAAVAMAFDGDDA